MSSSIGVQRIDAAIGELRLYLARDILSAFDGKETFEPNRDWAPIIAHCSQIRANDHVLTEHQKRNIDGAIDKLQSGLNDIVEILRTASTEKHRSPEREAELVQAINDRANSVNAEFEKAARSYYALSERSLPSLVNYGSVHMGDVFSNISHSSVVSRSIVEGAFNKLQDSGNHEAANLIAELGKIVAESNNHAAGAVFSQMAEQAAKPAPDKSIIKSCWDGLVAILPSVTSLTSSVLKAFGLV